MQDIENKYRAMQQIIKKIVKNQNLVNVAYDAISNDDILALEILKENGFNFFGNNYVFTAVDCSSLKCLKFLLEEGADANCSGKTFVDGKMMNVVPVELACLTYNVKALKIFIENGVKLQLFGGVDALRRYRKVLGSENTEFLQKLKEEYETKTFNETQK